MAGQVYAVLVGIDTYPAPVPTLTGCVNDVQVVADLLRARVGDDALFAVRLTNEQATRAAVVEAVRGHLGRAGADDVAVLYYSGHGSQQTSPPELWGGEPDHRDETLVCVDSRQPGSWDLADTELGLLVGEVSGGGAHTLVVLDCCHSGTGTRDLDERVRLAPEDARVRPAHTFLTAAAATPAGVDATVPPRPAVRGLTTPAADPDGASAGRAHVLLAACRADETAKEVTVLGRRRGALSAALEAALLDGEGRLTYREVLRSVTAGVSRRVAEQHPQLESADATELDRPFLGGALPTTPRQLTLSRLPDGWSIDYGAVHGVPEPIGTDSTELAVYALSAETSGTPLATATVLAVLPDRSLVSLSTPLDEGSVYRAVITAIPLRPVQVAVRGGDDTAALRAAAATADASLITLVEASPDADLTVEATSHGFVITRPGVTRPLVPVVAGEGRAERTVAALEHVARWLRLADLRNPATRLPRAAVRLDVAGGAQQPDGALAVRYDGDRPPPFTVTLTNTTATTLWVALIDLTETYGIFTDAVPAGSAALEPAGSLVIELTGVLDDELWRAGTVTVTDQLKLVTSTLEFDPRSLQQDELRLSAVGAGPTSGTTRGATLGADPGTRSVNGMAAHPSTRSSVDLPWVVGAGTDTTTGIRRLGPRPPDPTGPVTPAADPGARADWRTDEAFVRTTRPLT